jgi:putative ABC transport system ATP-binding protein
VAGGEVTQPVLEVRDLRFAWPGQAHATLDIPHFAVAQGERLFIQGPSGSGKSTLLGVLGGVLQAQSGTVRANVDGRSIDYGALGRAARDRFRVDHIGFVFQQFNLVPYLSVLRNVLLPCLFSRRRQDRAGGRAEDEARRLLLALDLDDALLQRPATQLSVGQQQRVAVARALIGRPDIVIADEPTSALDAARQERFLSLLMRECEASGAALLFVSHDERLSGRFDRVLRLDAINRSARTEDATA